jgi:hypothetical protein
MRSLLPFVILVLLITTSRAADDDKAARYKKLEALLTGAKLTGNFTITGKAMKDLPAEEYTIHSAEKAEEGEFWLLKASMKYGGKDTPPIPMPIEILWAGKTPVMTLDNLTLPGLGTFSARVVLHDDKYAGTWQHDKVGGHLFGTISKANEEEKGDEKNAKGDEKSPK